MASLGANNSSNSVIVEVTDHNGKPIFAEITQKADVEKVKRLKPLVQQGDVDALWVLAEIVERLEVGLRLRSLSEGKRCKSNGEDEFFVHKM